MHFYSIYRYVFPTFFPPIYFYAILPSIAGINFLQKERERERKKVVRCYYFSVSRRFGWAYIPNKVSLSNNFQLQQQRYLNIKVSIFFFISILASIFIVSIQNFFFHSIFFLSCKLHRSSICFQCLCPIYHRHYFTHTHTQR